jgi:hypothetical protein
MRRTSNFFATGVALTGLRMKKRKNFIKNNYKPLLTILPCSSSFETLPTQVILGGFHLFIRPSAPVCFADSPV